MIETDLLVVGAGPAGSSAAKAAAERGLDVLVLEARPQIGVPVRCGELVPSLQEILDMFPRLRDAEELFGDAGGLVRREVDSIRLVDPKGKEYRFPFTGYTTDRDRFDQHWAALAEEAGAGILKGCRFLGLRDGIAETSVEEVTFKAIVGADGPKSRTARALGLPANENCYPAVSAQAEGDFGSAIQMFFGSIAPGAYGWIIPKDGTANVGVGFSPKFSEGSLPEQFWKFAADHGLKVVSPMKGKYVPSEGPVARTVAGNGMLAGDAAGVVMPVNGGGIPQALITGRMAGDAAYEFVRNGRSLGNYEKGWREALYKPLKTAAGNKRLADAFAFRSDRSTSACMAILGTRRMGKLIRCKRILPRAAQTRRTPARDICSVCSDIRFVVARSARRAAIPTGHPQRSAALPFDFSVYTRQSLTLGAPADQSEDRRDGRIRDRRARLLRCALIDDPHIGHSSRLSLNHLPHPVHR